MRIFLNLLMLGAWVVGILYFIEHPHLRSGIDAITRPYVEYAQHQSSAPVPAMKAAEPPRAES